MWLVSSQNVLMQLGDLNFLFLMEEAEIHSPNYKKEDFTTQPHCNKVPYPTPNPLRKGYTETNAILGMLFNAYENLKLNFNFEGHYRKT